MVVDGDSKYNSSYMKVERRKTPRKSIPVNGQTPMIVGQLGSSFKQSRRFSRKKPTEKISACLLSERETHCIISDLSESGLCIFHTADLVEGQTVGVFLRILWGANKKDRGFTLICEVARHNLWAGPERTCHVSGLDIISKSDGIGYNEFVASLPPLETAHA